MARITEEIKAFAEKSLSETASSHDWDHTLRVYRLCMHIGQAEGADLEVLQIAAYLHDVGRPFQDASKGLLCHAEKGAAMAASLIEKYPIHEERKSNIVHCVRSHRFRGDLAPVTKEARVLYDADKLDSIGAVGIGRAFLFAGEVGARLHNPHAQPEQTRPYTKEDTAYREYKLKLSKIRHRMLTEEGRRMAFDRHAFMEAFFERFLKEYEGSV